MVKRFQSPSRLSVGAKSNLYCISLYKKALIIMKINEEKLRESKGK